MNDDIKTKLGEYFFLFLCMWGFVFNIDHAFAKNLSWFLYVTTPTFVLGMVMRHYFICSFRLSHTWREMLFVVPFVYLSSPLAIIPLSLSSIQNTKWYLQCIDRGYFIPSEYNRKKHVIRKLKGKGVDNG